MLLSYQDKEETPLKTAFSQQMYTASEHDLAANFTENLPHFTVTENFTYEAPFFSSANFFAILTPHSGLLC